MFNKHRLEALSDVIFAIVMTLLVLDLKVPEDPFPKHFAVHLTEQWLSFFITFMIAAIFWTLQHRLFELVDDIHQKTLVITFVFLALVSALPFSTALLGHRIQERSSYVVYYGHVTLIAVALTVKLYMLLHIQKPADSISVGLLKLRLLTLTSITAILTVACVFLPVRWIGITAAIAAALSRRLTKKRKAELEAMRVQPIAAI